MKPKPDNRREPTLDTSTPPATHSLEEMFLAIDRLGAGFSASTKRLPMSLGRAQDILRDVAREIVLLREESREWICTTCKMIYLEPKTPMMTCHQCGNGLRPAVVIRHAALLDQLRIEQAHSQRIEESLVTLLDFYGDVEESSET